MVEEELTDPETVRRIMRGGNDAAKVALIQMSASKRAAELARRERELDRRERESWNTDAALGEALDELTTLRREIALKKAQLAELERESADAARADRGGGGR